jgi:acetyltransferase-like isoleucine patch superfamily enzyme
VSSRLASVASVYNNAISRVGGALGSVIKRGTDGGSLYFPFVTQTLAMVPFAFGYKLRHAIYKSCMSHVGEGTVIHHGVRFDDAAQIIGDDVWISAGCYLELVEIGDHVLIGPHAVLLAGGRNHNFARTDIPIKLQGNQPRRPLKIGSGAWIGANATVMADVGHDAIVGAGAVVTRPVPPFAVVGGNPARLLRMRVPSP